MYKGVKLGTDSETKRDVWLSPDARRLSSYVIGAQGSGKTNLLVQIALQDIANGDGVCFITPHPDIEEILMRIPAERERDVVVFAPPHSMPIGLNVFERGNPKDITSIGAIADNVVMGTFELLWGESWGAQMEEFLRHITLTILYCQGLTAEKRPTLAEFAEVIEIDKDPKYRNSLLAHIEKSLDEYEFRVPVEALLKFWRQFGAIRTNEQEHLLRSTLNKARLWRTNPVIAHVVGQYENKLDLTQIMDEGKILLVDLNEVGEDNVNLFGSLLAGQLYLAAQRRRNHSPQFHIIADEFGYYASKAFSNLQDRTRKWGVDVLVAHQRREQLNEQTRSSTLTATNWIIFRVNPEDAKELAGGFSSEPPLPQQSGERERLIYAAHPWDKLVHSGHEDGRIMDIFHKLQKWVTHSDNIGSVYVADEPGLFLNHKDKTNKAINFIREHFGSTVFRFSYFLSPQDSEFLRQYFNEYLYIVMARPESVNWLVDHLYVLGKAVDLLFRRRIVRDGGRFRYDDLFPYYEDYQYLPERGQLSNYRLVDDIYQIFDTLPSEKWEGRIHSLLDQAARIWARVRVHAYLDDLSHELLFKPLWDRGGQPETQYEHPRTFSDVGKEWENRITQLRGYTAWARVQDDENGFTTYNLRPEKLPPAPRDGVERARRIRETSAQRYGVPRKEVDGMMIKRVRVDDQQPAYEVPDERGY